MAGVVNFDWRLKKGSQDTGMVRFGSFAKLGRVNTWSNSLTTNRGGTNGMPKTSGFWMYNGGVLSLSRRNFGLRYRRHWPYHG